MLALVPRICCSSVQRHARATVAVDASRHVDGDVRVRAVEIVIGKAFSGTVDQPGATDLLVKRLVRKPANRMGGVAVDEHLEDATACLLELRRVGVDLHAMR